MTNLTFTQRAPSIALVGMPGCGKSTVGRQVSKLLGWRFVDSDAEITRRIGMPIREFFDTHGEDAFRDIEAAVIAELCGAGRCVLATGGGAVLRPANRQALREHAHVVYLRTSSEELWRRLRHDTHRPLLQVADPHGRLRELFRLRDPLYREVAHLVLDAGRTSVHRLANLLLMQLELDGVLASTAAHAGGDAAGNP